MYHFRDTSSQSVLKNFSYCLFSSVYFQLLFINQCPLIFIVYPPMFLFFIVCPQLSLFVLVVNQCLFLLLFSYPLMSPFYCYCLSQCLFWFWLFTNVFIFDLLFIDQCLLLVVVYPLLFLLVLVVHQFLHLLFIVYPPVQCLLLVLWIHQCLLVLVVRLCLPFVIVCPQMYPFNNSLSTMSTFGKC